MTSWTDELEDELRMLIRREYESRMAAIRAARCQGKHRFPNPSLAWATVRKASMRPFWCRSCGGWHIAHEDRRRRLANERIRVA